jgi:hypothetical protein
MAAASILHVGDDLSYRIPVMETAGLTVVRSECAVPAVEHRLAQPAAFSAITFHCDAVPPDSMVVSATRGLSAAPLVLFQNPLIEGDAACFDLVIEAHTPPSTWVRSLKVAIENAHSLRRIAQALRLESRNTRSRAQSLQAAAARLREHPLDGSPSSRSYRLVVQQVAEGGGYRIVAYGDNGAAARAVFPDLDALRGALRSAIPELVLHHPVQGSILFAGETLLTFAQLQSLRLA